MLRPGGIVAIFDGDDASLTFGHPDYVLARRIDDALGTLFFASPRIMRDLPRLPPAVGLRMTHAAAFAYADIGRDGFFANMLET